VADQVADQVATMDPAVAVLVDWFTIQHTLWSLELNILLQ
jgi:hypothetical protein